MKEAKEAGEFDASVEIGGNQYVSMNICSLDFCRRRISNID